MSEEENKFLPCPFCGCKEVEFMERDNERSPLTSYTLCCKGCCCTLDAVATKEWLRDVWNDRVTVGEDKIIFSSEEMEDGNKFTYKLSELIFNYVRGGMRPEMVKVVLESATDCVKDKTFLKRVWAEKDD